MRTGRDLFVVSLLLLTATGSSPARDTADVKIGGDFAVDAIPDVAYYTGAGADANKNKLDLYLPKDQKDFPVLFFVHGGAWTSGDRKLYVPLGKVLAKNGIGAVIISYRLTPQVQHPGHIEDVARAFAWTHANIGKHGGRADQIFVAGHSAGGHLAALLVTNERYLKAHDLTPKAIKGAIPMSGVYIVGGGDRMKRVFGEGPEVAESASPLRHVTGKEPPFLILYADDDFPGCDRMSEAMGKALKAAKVEAECVSIKDRGHISIMVRLATSESDPATQAILAFVAKHSDLKLRAAKAKSEN
ncbi:MAG TPA: alpha/beta hydrolase [Gemmataceae bacterium]|jgi:acetyl esterase/lipase|nr:alpha/beta hydrolase [Gemmataceae bacterium]